MRKLTYKDKAFYLELANEFYSSEAVVHKAPTRNFEAAFNEMMRSDVYAEGYMLEFEDTACGYALISKTFSQEAGGIVVWLEELYIRPSFQGKKIGSSFIKELEQSLPPSVKRIRLEVTSENISAASLYKRLGFRDFNYLQMIKEL